MTEPVPPHEPASFPPPPPPPPPGAPAPAAPPSTAPSAPAPSATAPSAPAAGAADPVSRHALLAWLALVAIGLSVFLEEHGSSSWEQSELWSAFALVATAATVVPSMKSTFKLDDRGAWRVAAAGVAGLAGYWLLLVLPSIGQNTSFAATVALVLAGFATWSAPGRPELDES